MQTLREQMDDAMILRGFAPRTRDLRRGYHKTGYVRDYPLSAGAGTQEHACLKIEVLEKRTNVALNSTRRMG